MSVSADQLEEVRAQIRAGRFDEASPEQVLEWGVDTFWPRIALSASFGSPEGMVVLDMMHRLRPGRVRVFTIDTGRMYQETYDLMDRVRDKYGVEIEVYFPLAEAVERMVREHGVNLFYESPELRRLCCGVRKVEPLGRALADLDAWITGLRRGQAVTRNDVRPVEVDELHDDRVKLNPLARWSREDVEAYVARQGVPVNALHRRGFPTVGCRPCTRAVQSGEDERAGRWWWEDEHRRECGLHVAHEELGSPADPLRGER